MAYRTKAAHELIDHLHIQENTYAERAGQSDDRYDRALWTGMYIATKVYREYAEKWLENIEAEAELVPEPEPDPIEWLADQMADYRPMAGDYRDFPA